MDTVGIHTSTTFVITSIPIPQNNKKKWSHPIQQNWTVPPLPVFPVHPPLYLFFSQNMPEGYKC